MRHCVARYAASYARLCVRRETSIWSMRLEHAGRRSRVLTIEVHVSTRTIRQARRHDDARPDAKLRRIMGQWARQEGLTIEC
jgi:hypothetical protein